MSEDNKWNGDNKWANAVVAEAIRAPFSADPCQPAWAWRMGFLQPDKPMPGPARIAYISGPMRGLPEFNFPAFMAAEAALLSAGWHTISPARLDQNCPVEVLDPNGVNVSQKAIRAYFDRDVAAIRKLDPATDALVWIGPEDRVGSSKGTMAEIYIAQWLELPVLSVDNALQLATQLRDAARAAEKAAAETERRDHIRKTLDAHGAQPEDYGQVMDQAAENAQVQTGMSNAAAKARAYETEKAREAHEARAVEVDDGAAWAKLGVSGNRRQVEIAERVLEYLSDQHWPTPWDGFRASAANSWAGELDSSIRERVQAVLRLGVSSTVDQRQALVVDLQAYVRRHATTEVAGGPGVVRPETPLVDEDGVHLHNQPAQQSEFRPATDAEMGPEYLEYRKRRLERYEKEPAIPLGGLGQYTPSEKAKTAVKAHDEALQRKAAAMQSMDWLKTDVGSDMVGVGPEIRRPLGATASAPPGLMPSGAHARKSIPILRGVLDYFPAVIIELARLADIGGRQHGHGDDIYWERGKSVDHGDCLLRHLMERGRIDKDGVLHSVKAAWRAMAAAQLELEELGAEKARGAR